MKRKSLILCVFAIVLSFNSEAYAQGFINKLGKALENVNKTLNEVNSVVGGVKSNTSYVDSTQATKGTSGESSVGDANNNAFKLTTNHPDFKIVFRRCDVSGKTCVIDLFLENKGESDIEVYIPYGCCIAYDDQANEYLNISVAVGGNEWVQNESRTLLSGVQMKARIQIEGVSEKAKIFRRLDWKIECRDWGLGREKFVTFKNLPISREDDDNL